MTFTSPTCTGLLLATPSQWTLLSHTFISSRSVFVCSRGFSSHTMCRPTHQPRAPRGSCFLNPRSIAVRGFSERVCSAARPAIMKEPLLPPSSISTVLNFNGGQLNINNWYQWGPLHHCWQQYNISRSEHCKTALVLLHTFTHTRAIKSHISAYFLFKLKTHRAFYGSNVLYYFIVKKLDFTCSNSRVTVEHCLFCLVKLFGQAVRSHLHFWSSGTCFYCRCLRTSLPTHAGSSQVSRHHTNCRLLPRGFRVWVEPNYLCKNSLFCLQATLKQATPHSQLP